MVRRKAIRAVPVTLPTSVTKNLQNLVRRINERATRTERWPSSGRNRSNRPQHPYQLPDDMLEEDVNDLADPLAILKPKKKKPKKKDVLVARKEKLPVRKRIEMAAMKQPGRKIRVHKQELDE